MKRSAAARTRSISNCRPLPRRRPRGTAAAFGRPCRSAPTKGGSKDDDKAAKEREAQQAKQKELNDAFAAGRSAIDGKQWDDAITQLTKASELGPTQNAVWASLAEAYTGKAKSVKGDEEKAAFDKAFAAYDKLIEPEAGRCGSLQQLRARAGGWRKTR